jgi:hypothetical protein
MHHGDFDTTIPILGKAKISSPIQRGEKGAFGRSFVNDSERIVIDVKLDELITLAEKGKDFPSFELAGPRKKYISIPAS